jgi:hypothetical protein
MSVRNVLIHDEQLRLIAKAVRVYLHTLNPVERAEYCVDGCNVGEELELLGNMCDSTAASEPNENMVHGFAL